MANNLDLFVADFNSYVVTPINAFGLGGFVFDIEGETTASLGADATDHYVENNVAIQDHIAIKPKRFVLHSYVGELVYREDNQTDTILQNVVQKLTTLNSFLPVLAAGAEQVYAAIDNASISDISLNSLKADNINQVANLWGLVKNMNPNASRQMQAYMYFKALMEQKILVSMQTPFEFLTNMMILDVVAVQGEKTKYMTDFVLTLKHLRFAQTIVTAYTTTPSTGAADDLSPQANANALTQYRNQNGLATPPIDTQLQGRAALQAAPNVNGGNMLGLTTSSSSLPPGPLNQTTLGLVSDPKFLTNAAILAAQHAVP